METDRPFIGSLRLASNARAFVENMRPPRARSGVVRTLSRREIEERLDEIFRQSGEPAIQGLRDDARQVANQLGMTDEFQNLDTLIGSLLGIRETRLASPQRPLDAPEPLPSSQNRHDPADRFRLAYAGV